MGGSIPSYEFKTDKLFTNNVICNCGEDCPCKTKDTTQYKYNEDKIIQEFADYIKSTYGAHYVGKNNIQALDMWESLGSMLTSCRDTALKYLYRMGKKGTKEDFIKDLMKALHYIILMIYTLRKEDK